MAIGILHVAGYGLVREVRLGLGRVNVLLGPNGCGKTNLYRALCLLARVPSDHRSQRLDFEAIRYHSARIIELSAPSGKGVALADGRRLSDERDAEVACTLPGPITGVG